MIIASACKMLINNNEVVLCGVRHGDIYNQLKQMGFKPDDFKELGQGFVTHKNEFLNRHDAYIVASKMDNFVQGLNTIKIKQENLERYQN